jgi:TonB family protein
VQVHLPRREEAPLTVRMSRSLQLVQPVVVTAVQTEPNNNLSMVRERARTGGNGYYSFRKDFMKLDPANFTDILRRIPGVQVQRVNGFTEVRLRGLRCRPLYWVDGQSLLGIPFDPDLLTPETIEAVEVYSSASLVPPQFQGPPSAQGCGSVVIWTRHGEKPVRAPRIDADSIIHLLDAQRLFMASEVEVPAQVLTMQQPEYPDSLRAAGVSGSAVVEFIIDPSGKIDRESIGIVSATHVRFADAVRTAILEATFSPARKAGRAVAQVFQLPVTFNAPPGKP